MRILKLSLKLFLLFTSIALIALTMLLSPNVRSLLVYKISESFLNTKISTLKKAKVNVGTTKLTYQDIELKLFNQTIIIPKLEAKFDLKKLFTEGKTEFSISSDTISLNNDEIFIKGKIDGYYSLRGNNIISYATISSKNILSDKNISSFSLKSGIEYGKKTINLKNTEIFINDSKIEINGALNYLRKKPNYLKLDIALTNLPVNFYKAILKPENKTYQFLERDINDNAMIKNAKINLALDRQILKNIRKFDEQKLKKSLTDKNINGVINFENIIYSFNKDMPKVYAKNLTMKITGPTINIDLKDVITSESKVKSGRVYFDYIGDKINIITEALTSGSARGLINYIKSDHQENFKKSGIDLYNIKGNTETEIYLKIPLYLDQNIYKIKSKITSLNLSLFNEKLNFKNNVATGYFNGKEIEIHSNGLLNGYNNSTNVTIYLDETNDKNYYVTSTINLKNDGDKIPAFQIIEGGSNLNIEIDSNSKGNHLNISSNLRNTHFQIPSISLDKQKNAMANLHIHGNLKVGKKQNFIISLEGENDLNINGKIFIEDNESKFNFDKIQYLNNDFAINILHKENSLIAEVTGNLIDLSEFNNIKDEDEEQIDEIKLKFNIEKIKLKNDINLTDNLGWMECYKGICPIGRFSSNIDSKDYIIAEYKHNDGSPFWYLETNEAGKLLSGFGITNQIKYGYLKLKIDAPIIQHNPEEFSQGNIRISKFEAKQNKFLSKIISFVSLPGFINAISNKNITFDESITNFKLYKDKIIIDNSSNKGPYFNFFVSGQANLESKKIKLSGQVVPSLWGINNLLGNLPLLRTIFGKKGGVFIAPFIYHDKF